MENFWNNSKWYISSVVKIESFNGSFEWCNNRFFNLLSFRSLFNWNIFKTFNFNMLVLFACNWLVLISINLNNSFVDVFFCRCDRFVQKDWVICFWNSCQWDIVLTINSLECSDFSICFLFNCMRSIYWLCWQFYWYIYFLINENWSNFFVSNWMELLLIDCNNNFWRSFNIWLYSIFESCMVWFWNDWLWNICVVSNFESMNIIFSLYNFLDLSSFWSFLYWNVFTSFNSNW